MKQILFIALAALTQMSVGLADSDEDQNNIDGNYNGNIEDADLIDEIVAGFTGVLPANMFDEIPLDIQPCITPKKLIYNLDVLSSLISGTETLKNWIEEESIDKLNASRTVKPKELDDIMESLVSAAFDYRDETEYALDNATTIIGKANRNISSDVVVSNFLEHHTASFSEITLRDGCDIMFAAKDKVISFAKDINDYMNIFKASVDSESQISQIIASIEDLSTKYNDPGTDIEGAKRDIQNFIKILNAEAAVIPSRVVNANVILEKSVTEKAGELEEYFERVDKDYQKLLSKN